MPLPVEAPDESTRLLSSDNHCHAVLTDVVGAPAGAPVQSPGGVADDGGTTYRRYPQRFIVLLFFALAAMQQDQIWLTFGIIGKQTQDYYGVSPVEVDLLAAWGPITFIPSMFLCSWIMEKRGIRDTLFVAILLETVGAGVRVFAQPGGKYFGFVHLGQILNGMAGPFIMAPPPKLSAVWFPPSQRTTATTVGTMAAYVGSAIAFLLIPYLVNSYGMQMMLVWQFVMTGVIALAIAIYFPEAPPTPPSASSTVKRTGLLESWRKVRGNSAFWMLSICGGVSAGVFNAWASVISLILNKSGGFTDSTHIGSFFSSSSWIGFASTLLGIVVAGIAGPIADFFPGRLKLLILLLFGSAGLLYVWFSLAVQGLLAFLPALQSHVAIFCTAVLASTFLNAANPLFYEACVEATYPVPEGISVMMLVGLNNFSCLVFQVIGMCGFFDAAHPQHAKPMNWLLTGTVAGCWILALFYREKYKRMEVDEIVPPSSPTLLEPEKGVEDDEIRPLLSAESIQT